MQRTIVSREERTEREKLRYFCFRHFNPKLTVRVSRHLQLRFLTISLCSEFLLLTYEYVIKQSCIVPFQIAWALYNCRQSGLGTLVIAQQCSQPKLTSRVPSGFNFYVLHIISRKCNESELTLGNTELRLQGF